MDSSGAQGFEDYLALLQNPKDAQNMLAANMPNQPPPIVRQPAVAPAAVETQRQPGNLRAALARKAGFNNVPDADRNLLSDLFATQREDAANIRGAADAYEQQPEKPDLRKLAAIVDMWTGGNSASMLPQTLTPEEKQLHVAKLRSLASSADKDLTHEQIGMINNAAKSDTQLALAELKGQLTGMGNPFKRNNQLDKWQKDFGKDMDVYGSIRSVKGKIADMEVRASRLKTLIESVKSGNLDPNEMASLGEGMANLISNGALSEERVKHFIPSTAGKTMAEWTQWLTANPTGSEQQKFVDRYAYELQNEAKGADRQLADFRRKKVPSHQQLYKDPEGRQNMYLQASGLGMSPTEVDALFDPKNNEKKAANYKEIPDATEPGGVYESAAARGAEQVAARGEQPKAKKTISSKMYSPSRNQTKIIYSDKSEEIVDGKR